MWAIYKKTLVVRRRVRATSKRQGLERARARASVRWEGVGECARRQRSHTYALFLLNIPIFMKGTFVGSLQRVHWRRGWERAPGQRSHSNTLFLLDTLFLWRVLSYGPLACTRLGKGPTLTLFFQLTPYFYERYFCRVPLACAHLGKAHTLILFSTPHPILWSVLS
jgi:hypothetical protein